MTGVDKSIGAGLGAGEAKATMRKTNISTNSGYMK